MIWSSKIALEKSNRCNALKLYLTGFVLLHILLKNSILIRHHHDHHDQHDDHHHDHDHRHHDDHDDDHHHDHHHHRVRATS